MVKSTKWIDISVPLKDGMVHWPGDPEIKIHNIKDMRKGDRATVAHLSMGSHTGTHMDAPAHFILNTKTIDQMPLDSTVGLARVIEIKDPESIKIEELKKHKIKKGDRILFKTKNSALCWNTNDFVKDFVYISDDAGHWLGEIGVKCVGVDYLSVGSFRKGGHEIHKALLSKNVWIIEGLNLSKVKPGKYDLACLPLRIMNGDGSPARAILRKA